MKNILFWTSIVFMAAGATLWSSSSVMWQLVGLAIGTIGGIVYYRQNFSEKKT